MQLGIVLVLNNWFSVANPTNIYKFCSPWALEKCAIGMCPSVLLHVEETVALVADSDGLFRALYSHLPAGAGMTHQPATASAVVPSVKLTQDKVCVKTQILIEMSN